MTSPNIVGLGTILGFTTVSNLANSTETVFLNAPATTNTLYKVNNIIVANTTSSSVNATISFRDAAGGGGTRRRKSRKSRKSKSRKSRR